MNYALILKDVDNIEVITLKSYDVDFTTGLSAMILFPGEEVVIKLSEGSTFTMIPMPLLQGEAP